jgi:hypothetical protein
MVSMQPVGVPPEPARDYRPWRLRKGDIPIPAYKRMTPYATGDDTLYRNLHGYYDTAYYASTIVTVAARDHSNCDEEPLTVLATSWSIEVRGTINRRGNVVEQHLAGGDACCVRHYRAIAKTPRASLAARVTQPVARRPNR